jgi:glycosyltransferase involved in cell wall biosynthesis
MNEKTSHHVGAQRTGTAPAFTIFIPTFNRAYVLADALAGIDRSDFRDFEVLVIDDGSTDATAELVAAWQARVDFPLRYYYQPNQGKHVAHNTAAGLAQGELFLTVDSDDVLLPEALVGLWRAWQSIPTAQRAGYAGVVGLCQRWDGSRYGNRFREDPLDSEFLTVRHQHGLSGEKRCAVRTDLLRVFPYPVFAGERHSRPSIIFNRMSHGNRFRFTNTQILRVGHQPDGISANRRKIRRENPLGYRQYFLELITDHRAFVPVADLASYYVRYIKYSLVAHVGLGAQLHEIPNRWMWLLALPIGILKGLRHRHRAVVSETFGHTGVGEAVTGQGMVDVRRDRPGFARPLPRR